MKKIQKGNDIYIRWNITKNKELVINNPKVLLLDTFKKEQIITYEINTKPVEIDEGENEEDEAKTLTEELEVNISFKGKDQKTCGKYILKFVNEEEDKLNTLYVTEAFIILPMMDGVIEDGEDESVHTIVGYELESILNPSAFVDLSSYYTKAEIDNMFEEFSPEIPESNTTLEVSKDSESIVANNISYDLKIDKESNTIAISKYEPISLTITGDLTLEYDDSTTSRTVTATITGTKANAATLTWSNREVGYTVNQTITKNKPSKLSATATDNRTSSTKETNVYFAPIVIWCSSVNEDLQNIDSDNVDNYNYSVQSNGKIENKKITLLSAGYIYYASAYKPNTYYISGTNSRADSAGGFIDTGKTFTKYSNKTTFYIYRTTTKQAAGTYRIDFV